MKRLVLIVATAGLLATGIRAQDASSNQKLRDEREKQRREANQGATQPDLPRFDLDFPGGTPQELVDAIRDRIDKGILNVIIPTEHATLMLPPMKMKAVTVKQLFDALEAATRRVVPYETGRSSDGRRLINERQTSIGFQTIPPIQPESVWSFYASTVPEFPEQKSVRYFQLKQLLDQYNIEDITTAIQAGWKMLGDARKPELNFHQETKLLIAAGAPHQLEIINAVLEQLRESVLAGSLGRVDPVTGQPIPVAKPK